jgi:hypothetical protein
MTLNADVATIGQAVRAFKIAPHRLVWVGLIAALAHVWAVFWKLACVLAGEAGLMDTTHM